MISPGASNGAVKVAPHLPQNFDSEGLWLPHPLQGTWLSEKALSIHGQEAVSEPRCGKDNQEREGPERVLSAPRHRQRLIDAVVTNADALAVALSRPLARSPFCGSRLAWCDFDGASG
jgi:hypothetical protein